MREGLLIKAKYILIVGIVMLALAVDFIFVLETSRPYQLPIICATKFSYIAQRICLLHQLTDKAKQLLDDII